MVVWDIPDQLRREAPVILRGVQPDEVDLLVSRSAKIADSARWVRGLLERGDSRLSWCRVAVEGDELLAAQALDSWSPDRPPADVPTFVRMLGHTDREAATALLINDLQLFRATCVHANLSCGADATRDLRRLRQDQHQVLLASGFELLVDRVSAQWSGAPLPTVDPALTFQPAADVPEEDLLKIFAAVGDGSADHGMRSGRADHGRREEASTRLRAARRRTYEHHWFAVARDALSTPVGYVQSALINGRAVLAEVGVVEAHRGRRIVDQLLTYGTNVLTAEGNTHIRAHTDQANLAMRRAFARAGYTEAGTRRDYRWSLDPS